MVCFHTCLFLWVNNKITNNIKFNVRKVDTKLIIDNASACHGLHK